MPNEYRASDHIIFRSDFSVSEVNEHNFEVSFKINSLFWIEVVIGPIAKKSLDIEKLVMSIHTKG